MRTVRRRFDGLEVLLLCAAVGAVVLLITKGRAAPDRQKPYRDQYGSKVSLGPEEWIVRDFFHDQRGGVFVDVGPGTRSPIATPTTSSGSWAGRAWRLMLVPSWPSLTGRRVPVRSSSPSSSRNAATRESRLT